MRRVVAVHHDPVANVVRWRLSCGHSYSLILQGLDAQKAHMKNAADQVTPCPKCRAGKAPQPRTKGSV